MTKETKETEDEKGGCMTDSCEDCDGMAILLFQERNNSTELYKELSLTKQKLQLANDLAVAYQNEVVKQKNEMTEEQMKKDTANKTEEELTEIIKKKDEEIEIVRSSLSYYVTENTVLKNTAKQEKQYKINMVQTTEDTCGKCTENKKLVGSLFKEFKTIEELIGTLCKEKVQTIEKSADPHNNLNYNYEPQQQQQQQQQ